MRRNDPRTIVSISVPAKDRPVLEAFDKLVKLERCRRGRSELTITAWREYCDRHLPGNPQKPLSPPDPARDKAAIAFLRTQAGLSYRQIALVVNRTYHYVRRVCKLQLDDKMDHRWSGMHEMSRRFKAALPLYRKRFQAFMTGRYSHPREAFKF